MKHRNVYWFLTLVLMLSLLLAACSSGEDTEAQTDADEGETEEEATKEPVDGGTLTYGIDSEPEGILNIHFYGSAVDDEILGFMVDPLIEYDENLEPEPHLATWETEDNKVFTFTFEEGVKWHDGDELTVHDWVFAIETLAHPDYDGPRYTNVQTIEGAEAFNKGEADSISGLEVVNDYEIKVTFDQARVNNLVNVWAYPMHEDYWKDVPVKDMLKDEKSRTKSMGTGPFKMGNVVPGESYELIANEDYWKGAPKLDKVIVKVIDNKTVSGALQNGEIDMISVHPTLGEEIEKLDGVNLVTYPGLSYYYVGFKFGKFDNEKKEIASKNDKYDDLKLRQAMYHAINRQEWIDAFFGGYGSPVNAPVPTSHWIAADESDLTNYEYDPEKAKTLLDEAGFEDTNGDGFRENPDGEEFVVNFSHYATTNPTFESRAKALTQYWNDIGLQTDLQMIEASLYYDKVEKDSDDIEVFFGGWSTGSDPDPTGLWSSETLWNYTRYDNEKSDELLAQALDVEVVGDDQEKRKDIYTEWQQLLNEELPMLYIGELQELVGMNERVGGVKYDVSENNNPNEWYITE
ncbi:oligopeptide ABC transporter substrate-binding protein [Pontibacillus salicampi]|uniref:Oligopeptide ABC transporter substrate-binding protein n=1 Tax=Pontibacillus salicampi TaxID=1449801 RepID=A0ABV6LLR0_9BACI